MARDERRAGRSSGVSRRDFIKGLGVGGALGAGILGGEACDAVREPGVSREGGATTYGPEAVSVRLQVNGAERTLRLEPRATLLDALREHLDLTGTKNICDRGECGGCTVLLEGRPVYACMLLALDARGRSITTVEGIAPRDGLHPVQQAFVSRDALQCGFCTPGFVVASKALLDENPAPSLEQVKSALCGHLCRCGTYPRVFDAVLDVARGSRPKRAG